MLPASRFPSWKIFTTQLSSSLDGSERRLASQSLPHRLPWLPGIFDLLRESRVLCTTKLAVDVQRMDVSGIKLGTGKKDDTGPTTGQTGLSQNPGNLLSVVCLQ